MLEYCRAREPGGTYFFTHVTFDRQPILIKPQAGRYYATRGRMCNQGTRLKRWQYGYCPIIYTPYGNCLREIRIIRCDGKRSIPLRGTGRIFTREYLRKVDEGGKRNASRVKQGEAAIWQRRYWEHTFEDEEDLNTHIDYIHFNPVKHGLAKQEADWPWSSFHKYVQSGVFPSDWGGVLLDVGCGE